MNIDFGKAFSFAFKRLTSNPLFYIVGGLIISVISVAIAMLSAIFDFALSFAVDLLTKTLRLHGATAEVIAAVSPAVISVATGMIAGFLVAPIHVGFFKGVKKEYEGQEAELGDIFSAINIFLPSMLNYAAATIIIWLGLLFCIIPGLLLAPMLSLTLYFLAQGEDRGLKAVKKSFQTLTANPILILWTLVTGLIAILGVLLCLVGAFVTYPLATVIMYVIIAQAVGDAGKISESDGEKAVLISG